MLSCSYLRGFIVGACLSWGMTCAAQAPAPPSTTATVEPMILRIGLLVADRGPEAARGEEVRAGATLAVETINRTGGIHGFPLRLEVAESAGDVRSTVKAFSQLTETRDLAAIITAGEDDASVVRNLGEFFKVLVLSNSLRTDPLPYTSYMLRVGRSAAAAHAGLVEFMSKRKFSRIGVLRGDEGWVGPMLERLDTQGPRSSYQVVFSDSAGGLIGSQPTALLSRLKAEPAVELLYVAAARGVLAKVMKFLGEKHATSTALVGLYACPHDGLQANLSPYSGAVYSVDVDTGGERSKKAAVATSFKARFPSIELTVDALIGYDAAMMVADAYRAGFGASDAVRDYIVNQKVYFGAAGRLEFLTGGDTTRPVVFNSIQEGACRPLKLE